MKNNIVDIIKDKKTLFLFPHPDDECYSSAALINKLISNTKHVYLLYLTHGAPKKDKYSPPLKNFFTYEEYRQTYKRELIKATRGLGLSNIQWSLLNYASSTTFLNIKNIYLKTLDLITDKKIDVIFTCPYEGAHVDHDICSYITSVIGQKNKHIKVFEYASYFLKGGKFTSEKFLKNYSDEFFFPLEKEEIELKKSVCDVYRSQCFMLKMFSLRSERFRIQPSYDYTQQPAQEIYYESWQKEITAKLVLRYIASSDFED